MGGGVCLAPKPSRCTIFQPRREPIATGKKRLNRRLRLGVDLRTLFSQNGLILPTAVTLPPRAREPLSSRAPGTPGKRRRPSPASTPLPLRPPSRPIESAACRRRFPPPSRRLRPWLGLFNFTRRVGHIQCFAKSHVPFTGESPSLCGPPSATKTHAIIPVQFVL